MPRPANPDLRDEIRDTAEKVVQANGHAAINMRSLASRLGITATTIYNYFRDKEGVVEAVRIRAATRLNERIASIPPGANPHEVIRRIGEEYIAFAEAHPNLYRLLFEQIADEGCRPEPKARAELYYTYFAARKALAALQDTGEHSVDPRYGAMLGWIMLHGFCSLLISGRLEPDEGLDRATLKRVFLTVYSRDPFGRRLYTT